MYPLFRVGSDYLGNSCARISLRFQDSEDPVSDFRGQEESIASGYPEDEDSSNLSIDTACRKDHANTDADEPVVVLDHLSATNESKKDCGGLGFRILIDEALHLRAADDADAIGVQEKR